MTNKERSTIEKLTESIESLRNIVLNTVQEVQSNTDKKLVECSKACLPTNLEGEILKSAQEAISTSIHSVLVGYNSPLSALVSEVINQNKEYLRGVISDSFNQVIRTDDFKKSIVNAFSHKVARTIISTHDGLFDTVSNELKQDAIFKSKMSLAVANVVEECLKEKKQ